MGESILALALLDLEYSEKNLVEGGTRKATIFVFLAFWIISMLFILYFNGNYTKKISSTTVCG